MPSYKYQLLSVENVGDFVVSIKLNRPKKMNALNDKIWAEIGDVFARLEEDPDCRVVVLSGEGKAFTSGLDLAGGLTDMLTVEDGEVARKARLLGRKIKWMQECFTKIEKLSKPVIAAVHGICFGGGVDIISACDIRHCTKDALFSIKEVDIGIAADVGSLNRLPKIIGNESWLKEITYTARNFDASEALRFDLVSKVYETREDMLRGVFSLARTIGLKSPVAVQGSKVILNYSRDHTVDDSLNFVATWNQSQLFTEDIAAAGAASIFFYPKRVSSRMGDVNAWDIMEGQGRGASVPRRSLSPARTSHIDSEFDAIDLQALGIGRQEIAEAERERRRRSKSPALDTIRRVSRRVLERMHVIRKREDAFLYLDSELERLPFDDYCKRPKEFFREAKPFSFRELGWFPKPEPPRPEKCAYLFRGVSVEEEDDFPEHLELDRIPDYDPFCPVHGSRRRIARSRLVTMQSLMSSVDHDITENVTATYDQEFVAKLIRQRRKAQEPPALRQKNQKAMRKIKSNLWIISLAFLFLFTAFNGLQNLQTTINREMGADSLIVFYVSLAVSAVFVPSFMIDRLGCKMTIAVSMAIYIVYLVVNIRPSYYSLLPASVLAGIAGACVWGAQCVYIVEIGMKYSRLNYEGSHTVIFRFFGFFFMIFHMGQVIGNYISSLILTAAIRPNTIMDSVDRTCGYLFPANESELSPVAVTNLQRPPQRAYTAVLLAYLACAIISVMILTMFLNALTRDALNRQRAPSFDPEFLRLLWDNRVNSRVLLLVPLTLFNGIGKAFVHGVFTKSFVACGMGVQQIGFIGAAFGLSDAVCSLVFGPLIKLFGRMPLFVFGAVVNLLMILTLMIWPLNPADTAIFYVVAWVWGMADGVWNTQINGFWVALVGRSSLDFAFTNYRIWESLGIACGYLMARSLTVNAYLLVSAGFLLVGMVGYSFLENYELVKEYMKQMLSVLIVPRGNTSLETSLISKMTKSADTLKL